MVMDAYFNGLPPKERQQKLEELAKLGAQGKADIFPFLEEVWKNKIDQEENTTIWRTVLGGMAAFGLLSMSGAGLTISVMLAGGGALYLSRRALAECRWLESEIKDGNYEEVVTPKELKALQQLAATQKDSKTSENKAFQEKFEKLMAHFEEVQPETKPIETAKPLSSEQAPEASQTAPKDSPALPPLIGPQTQLGALDVQAEMVDDDGVIVAGRLPTNYQDLANTIVQRFAQKMQSLLVVGMPGTGKDMFVANLISILPKANPRIKHIIATDAKGSMKERGNFQLSAYTKVFSQATENWNSADTVAWFKEQWEAFKAIPNDEVLPDGTIQPCGKVWVINEYTRLCSTWETYNKKEYKEFANWVVSVTSGGDSEDNYIVAVAQISNAGDLGISAGRRDLFKPVAIIKSDDQRAYTSVTRTKFVPKPPNGEFEIAELCSQSPVGRAIYDYMNNVWLPMPKLHNFTGYDRDNRRWLKAQKAPKVDVQPIAKTPDPVAEEFAQYKAKVQVTDKQQQGAKQVAETLIKWLEAKEKDELRAGDLTSNIHEFRKLCTVDGKLNSDRKEKLLVLLRLAAEMNLISNWQDGCEYFGLSKAEDDILDF